MAIVACQILLYLPQILQLFHLSISTESSLDCNVIVQLFYALARDMGTLGTEAATTSPTFRTAHGK